MLKGYSIGTDLSRRRRMFRLTTPLGSHGITPIKRLLIRSIRSIRSIR